MGRQQSRVPSDFTQIADVAAAAARLHAGGVVAFPTETVYGLGADALSPAAVARVFELKGRPAHNPLIVHVTGSDMARRVAAAWPDRAETLAQAFWPGPLSIVLPRRPEVPDTVAAGGPTVAVRCPDHPLALALLFQFGGPLVGPSANKSGRVSPTTSEHVREAFTGDDVLVLEGGSCPTGIESTVVQLTETGTRILRPGVIGARELSQVLRQPVEAARSEAERTSGPLASDGAPRSPLPSPGLLESHYAPAAPASLVPSQDLESRVANAAGRIALISHRTRRLPPPHTLITLPPDARGYAAGLYAALRDADRAAPAQIFIEQPPASDAHADSAIWIAVLDRLGRATARG